MFRPTLGAMFAAGLIALPAAAQQTPPQNPGALRPEIGKPLAQAKSFLAARNYARATAAVNAADRVRNKSAQESFVIEEMRGAIAQQSGDIATASRTYQAMLDSGRVPPAEQTKLLMAEASMAYQQKNYPAVVSWTEKYLKSGGRAPEMQTLLIQAYYLQGDYANAGKLQAAQIDAARKLGQKPTEQQLQLLANCYEHTGDKTAFQRTMVQLVYFYPKPDYWMNLIHDIETKPGFNRDRFAFDVDRFELQLGTLTKPDDLIEMTELALQAPLPGEAKAIVDKGYSTNVLGQGADAPRHQRLRDLVNKTYDDARKTLDKSAADAAGDKDGNKLFTIGEEYVSYGDYDKGLSLMEQAMKKDQLRHPEDAKLHLGYAYFKAGKKADALRVFRTTGGNEGAKDIAYLWILYIGKA